MKRVKVMHQKQVYTTRINGYSHTGDGVGRLEDGRVVFIPQAVREEKVSFTITTEKKSLARGRLVAVLEASPGRVQPVCPVYASCGGCQLQHLSYQEQLHFKQQQVADALRRLGGLSEVRVEPVLGMEHPWHYRHTVRLHALEDRGITRLGFYQEGTHRLKAVGNCPLLPGEFPPLLRETSLVLSRFRGHGIREAVLRKGWGTGELLLILEGEKQLPAALQAALRALSEDFPALAGIVHLSGSRGAQNRQQVLLGRDYYLEKLAAVSFRVPARAFFQNNPSMAEVLVRTARAFSTGQGLLSDTSNRRLASEPKERKANSPDTSLLDLYCGVGLFSLTMASSFEKVLGIEENPAAIAAARANAAANGISHASFMAGKAEQMLPRLKLPSGRPDTVLLDPPRTGCHPEALQAIAALKPERVIYVSCNPATLARDLALLAVQGYQAERIQPVDLFPQSHHVECIVLIKRAENRMK